MEVTINHFAESWFFFMARWSVQAVILSGTVLVAVFASRKVNPKWHYALLMLAILKFAVPPSVTSPTSVFGAYEIAANVDTASTELERPPVFNIDQRRSIASETASAPTRDLHVTSTLGKTRAARSQPFHWNTWILFGYVAGVFVSLVAFAKSVLRIRRCTRNAAPMPQTLIDVEHLSRQCGLTKPPRICISEEAETAIAIGLFRPTVIVPRWATSQLAPPQLRWVIAHEMIHHRRGDVWVSWAQSLLFIGWWFHPALWILNRKLRSVRELCCDDAVIAAVINISA